MIDNCAAARKQWLTPVVLRAMSILTQRTTHLMMEIMFKRLEIVSYVSQPGFAPYTHIGSDTGSCRAVDKC